MTDYQSKKKGFRVEYTYLNCFGVELSRESSSGTSTCGVAKTVVKIREELVKMCINGSKMEKRNPKCVI